MRRCILTLLVISMPLVFAVTSHAQQPAKDLELQKLPVPAVHAKAIATKLNIQYRDLPGVTIAPDPRNEQLVVMAPKATQRAIAHDFKAMLASHVQGTPSRNSGPLNVPLRYITWREFEDNLQELMGGSLPITTSRNGERAAFQLTAMPMQGTTVEVDRRNNSVTVVAPQPALPGWKKMIAMLDKTPTRGGDVLELLRLENAEPAPIQKALRLLKELEDTRGQTVVATPAPAGSPFRNAVFQQNAAGPGGQAQPAPAGDPAAEGDEGGAGVIGDTQIQFVPELGTIIIRGAKRDVERVMDVIKQIEEQSEITKPEIDVVQLKHADANAVAELLQQLYEDVLSARQGEVSITSLDSPNALLLIGRKEAIEGLKELIDKIDQPVDETSRLRVFRLQYASALDAEQTVRDFFTDRPSAGDDLRPGLGPRVRVLADYRTNSLIVSAAPRDMIEVTRLINDLDVEEIAAQTQLKVFPLSNAVAEDLAPVIQSAINGEPEGGSDEVTAPSTNLTIVAVDSQNNQTLDSGILAGAVVTAETNANAVVVRAPAASMPLIAELIRQLDRAPGIDSYVKVFTIEYGDALQLTTSLQNLFGDDAAVTGTQVGAANLPPATGGSESTLVPLVFSADQRTNSIIASGSAEDLDVVESILLRLDGEGFAERVTEVIWLRHQAAADIALAIDSYVQTRQTRVNQIQQYQQGLGPYDLPDRDLIVVAEGVTNSILLSVSPRLYEEVRGLIDRLDRRPPMVLIKVMIAEVQLDDAFEIGGEVGLQDSLLYDRGIAAGAFPGATEPSIPGFDFNNNGLGAIVDPVTGLVTGNSFGQGNLATRGVSTFGVGTTNSNLGYGGFVLSAASDSISLLLRTLQDASRLQILSRPQIMTMDNTEGFVNVGAIVARVTGVQNLGVGQSQVITQDIDVGITLSVRPRVGADGLIVMDVDATRSARDDSNGTLVPTADGVVLINDILQTTAQSTIAAYSGQTVIYGGLIQKTRAQFSRRVPYLADIPILGYWFKYDQEAEQRDETIVIMTPMLVTGEEDLEYIKQTESARMSWCLADVVESHGDVGLSGGYGLWGPAVGATIYPDMQPTVDDIIIQDVRDEAAVDQSGGMIGEAEMIMPDEPTPAPAIDTPNVPSVVSPPAQSFPNVVPPSDMPAPVTISPQANLAPAVGAPAQIRQSDYQTPYPPVNAQGSPAWRAAPAAQPSSRPRPSRLGSGN